MERLTRSQRALLDRRNFAWHIEQNKNIGALDAMQQGAAPCCIVQNASVPMAAIEGGVRVTATITKQQDRLLRALAQRHKVSVAWLIRHAVDRLLSEGSAVQLPLDLGTRR